MPVQVNIAPGHIFIHLPQLNRLKSFCKTNATDLHFKYNDTGSNTKSLNKESVSNILFADFDTKIFKAVRHGVGDEDVDFQK